ECGFAKGRVSMETSRPLRLSVNRLTRLSWLWAALGLLLALAVPWLGLSPDWLQAGVNSGAPLLTAVLILWNVLLAIRLVGITGRTLSALPLTLNQFVLFTLLFLQIG